MSPVDAVARCEQKTAASLIRVRRGDRVHVRGLG